MPYKSKALKKRRKKQNIQRNPANSNVAHHQQTPQTNVEALRAIENPTTATLTPNAVLQLQRMYGNAYVQRLIAQNGMIQRDPEEETLGESTATGTKEGEGKSSSDVFDGTTQTVKEEAHSYLLGAKAKITKLTEATDEQLTTAVEVLARAGAFGESERKIAIERGKAKLEGQGKASGKAGASAGAKGTVQQDITKTEVDGEIIEIVDAIRALGEAHAMVGVEGELEATLKAAYGDKLAASLTGKLKGFAGAKATVTGSAEINFKTMSISLAGEASAMAGAEGEAGLEGEVTIGDVAIKGEVGVGGLAGAKAEAKGKLGLSLSGIEAEGKAEAFAGTKAEAKAGTSASYKGREFFKIEGKVEVSAGVGGSVEGKFSFKNGKLVIGGGLSAALGIGGGAGFQLEVDLALIGEIIMDAVRSFFMHKPAPVEIDRKSPADGPIPLDDTLRVQVFKGIYEAVINDFNAYGKKKAGQGDNFVKMDKVQAIIDKRVLLDPSANRFVNTEAANEAIEMAAKDAFGSQLEYIDIQAGIIRAFQTAKKKPKESSFKKLF